MAISARRFVSRSLRLQVSKVNFEQLMDAGLLSGFNFGRIDGWRAIENHLYGIANVEQHEITRWRQSLRAVRELISEVRQVIRPKPRHVYAFNYRVQVSL